MARPAVQVICESDSDYSTNHHSQRDYHEHHEYRHPRCFGKSKQRDRCHGAYPCPERHECECFKYAGIKIPSCVCTLCKNDGRSKNGPRYEAKHNPWKEA